MLLFKIWIGFGVLVLTEAQNDAGDENQITYKETENGPSLPENFIEWSYDIFGLDGTTNGQPLMYLVPTLFNLYGLIDKFNINPTSLTNFLYRIQAGYKRYNVSYHNDFHAADITRTLHSIIWKTGLKDWMTDLEVFASLFAAIIHDYEHMGLTNDFLVNTAAERALIYNDISVNENHHVSASFRIVKDDCCNILSNLSSIQYQELRKLVINMVLSTDMSLHSEVINKVKYGFTNKRPEDQRSTALGLLLHVSDISNPVKSWSVAYRWLGLIMDEFFKQGDMERELGLPVCMLCDSNMNVPKSQIYFTTFIVKPSFEVLTDMIEYVLSEGEEYRVKIQTPWVECIRENLEKWKLRMQDVVDKKMAILP